MFIRSIALMLLIYAPAAQAQITFSDLPRETNPLSDEQADILLRWCADPTTPIPQDLRDDRNPRMVFVSMSDGKSRARIAMGLQAGIVEAVTHARSGLVDPHTEAKWFRLDVVDYITSLENVPIASLKLEGGVEGLALQRDTNLAFHPDVMLADSMFRSDGAIDPQRFPAQARIGDPSDRWKFTARSYFFDGQTTSRIFRGHFVLAAPVDADHLLASVKQAGEYLLRELDDSGKFQYLYVPNGLQPLEPYNLVRHAGTLHALLEIYQITHDDRYLAAVKKGLAYLARFYKPILVGDQDAMVVDTDGFIALHANALSVLVLAEYAQITGDLQHLDTAKALARWMILTQNARGQFTVHRQELARRENISDDLAYCEGEAIFALAHLHRVDPTGPWLESAKKGTRFMIESRYADLPDAELTHDHWLLYGMNEIHRIDPQAGAQFIPFTKRLSSVIAAGQIRVPRWPDWAGGFARPPQANPSATRIEGLCAAWWLLHESKNTADADALRPTLDRAASFLLQLQFQPPSVMFFDDPQRPLGAFHENLTDYAIRMDTVQHNISALLGVWKIIRPRP